MKIEIKHKISGAVLFSCEAGSIKLAVKLAIGAKTDLSRAYLSGADLDYSCWPLWCGSKKVKIDVKIAAQLAAHFCAVDCEDKEYQKARKAILKFALTSHRASDLGIGMPDTGKGGR